MQTIVSRSQAFYCADNKIIDYKTDFFEKYFENYPNFDKEKAMDFAYCLLNYQVKNELDPKYVIDCIQYYLTMLLKANYNNKNLLNIILKDIEKTQNAKKMADSYIKEQTIYEDLAFYFAKK